MLDFERLAMNESVDEVAAAALESPKQLLVLIFASPDHRAVGGVDAHAARGWTIRRNRIEGFWCPSGLSEHAIHFWSASRGTLVERNTIIDAAQLDRVFHVGSFSTATLRPVWEAKRRSSDRTA